MTMSAPRPGNSNFTDDQIAQLPIMTPTPRQMMDDIMSRPMDDTDPKTATTQVWWHPKTGWGYDVLWYGGQWIRCPNGARRDLYNGAM